MMDKYYLGLDMGTSSVGWVVTDKNYQLIRKKGKDLWGVREFEEAETSADRRTHRINRRKTQRNKIRIGLVKDYFKDEIDKVDPYFYQRLENSKYYLEDKDEAVRTKNGIFNDKGYSDKEYYKEYPTIFHLRKDLIQNESKQHDIRLIYLAVLNLFKRRGHFLNGSLGIDNEELTFSDAYKRLIRVLADNFEEDLMLPNITEDTISAIQEIFATGDCSRTKKVELIAEKIGINKKDKKKYELIKAICGLNVDYKKLFGIEGVEEKIEGKFSDFSYADKEPELMDQLGENLGEVVITLKNVYDAGSLVGILKGEQYLSYARVKDYEKHKRDLEILKRVIRKYYPEKYDAVFREQGDGSYSAYVNSLNHNGSIRRNMKKRAQSDFYAAIKKMLPKNSNDSDVNYILNSIEAETFLPKQLTAANGVIPNQIHAKELNAILTNAARYYDFLNDIDDSGLSVKERILRLYTFCIPYYIGPTSEDSKTGWVVRKEKGQILPWNIDEKIDVQATSEAFINRMVRRCTYLNDEQVLPKMSLLYETYMVLNEINNIRINGVRINNNLKQRLFNDIYKNGNRPTRKQVENWLFLNGVEENASITGIDKQMNNGLFSYGKFKTIFGNNIECDSYKEVIEDIILKCTIYGDSKNLIVEYINKHYPEEKYPELTQKNIKKIIGFKLKDWGRFSKELLTLVGCEKSTGEKFSIIRAMWETNYNFVELINSDLFTFKEELAAKEKNALKCLSDYSNDILDDFYFSAPVKKMIHQTILIIKEVTEIMGSEPDRVFIEMVRHDEEKGDAGRKDSRCKQLQELYKNIKDELHDKNYWKDLIDKENESGRLRSKKMYLYLRQMGRDMYTGEEIDLDDLFNDNKYDIDHIYPRHFVKDDSIENNLVLSSKRINEEIKKDYYPIPDTVRNNPKVVELWNYLHEKGFINDEKYSRLIGSREFSDEQRSEFIARQMVETSQGTKGVADILKHLLPNSKIVYSKATNVSRFRHDNNLYKTRVVNENHHAYDAYLNVVVGNVYFTKFTDDPLNFIKQEYNKNKQQNNYNLNKMFDRKVERNGYVAWVPYGCDEIPTMEIVKKVLTKNTPMITRQSFEKHGIMNKVTVYGKSRAKAKSYLPLKTSDAKLNDVTKYGGYTSLSVAYFFVVEHEKKGELIKTIEALPGYVAEKVAKNPEELEQYCSDVLQLNNFKILIRKLKIQSLLEINGYRVHLSGRSNDQILLRNAVSMCLKTEWINYISIMEKYMNGQEYYEDAILVDKNMQLYDELMSKHNDTLFNRRKPYAIGDILTNGREHFNVLDKHNQCIVLLEILKFSASGTEVGDLSKIGRTTSIGKMRISKNLGTDDEILLINQSVTGFYENTINLRKI